MLKCLPKLKHLTIHGLHMTENLENSTFPLLESLELKGKIISNTGLMENNPKIKTLDIDVCAMAEGLIEANFDQLESLKLCNMADEDDSELLNIYDHILNGMLKNNQKLKSLSVDMKNKTGFTGEGLSGMLSELEDLNLCGCANLTETGLKNLLSMCPKLKNLKFESLNNKYEGLNADLPNLKTLVLGRDSLKYVSDSGLSCLMEAFPQIERDFLCLDECLKITGEGLKGASFQNVKHLTLRNCANVTDEGIVNVSICCPNLTSLKLEGASKISFKGILAKFDSLEKLILQNIDEKHSLTELGLCCLVKSCPKLVSL